MYLNKQSSQYGWCVYSLTELGHEKPDFVWYCKVAGVANMRDAIKNPNFNSVATYHLQLLSYHPDKMTAYAAYGLYIKTNGMPPLNLTQWTSRRSPVRCEQTGVQYNNAAEAAEALQINRSQLSQHLRRNPGYRTIKGMTFVNVTDTQPAPQYYSSAPPA